MSNFTNKPAPFLLTPWKVTTVGFVIFIFLLVVLVTQWKSPEKSRGLIYGIEIISVCVLSLILFGYYKHHHLEYLYKAHASGSGNQKVESGNQEVESGNQEVEKKIYYTRLYSSLSTVLIAILCMIYTVYSDVFYQQGDPVSPIVYGLRGNVSETNIASNVGEKDTANIIFIIDVSSSTNNYFTKDTAWLKGAADTIASYCGKSSGITNIVKNRDHKKESGLWLIKLKACLLLIQIHKKAQTIEGQQFLASVISFGKDADIEQRQMNIVNVDKLDTCMTSILKLTPYELQREHTDFAKITTKLEKFPFLISDTKKRLGVPDKFSRQRNAMTILSDFIQDPGLKGDSALLEATIDKFANNSIYFNLYSFDSLKPGAKPKGVNIVPFFDKLIYPKLINKYSLSDQTEDLKLCHYESPSPIVFFIEKPFYVDRKVVKIRNKKEGVKVCVEGCDERQQLNLENNIIKNGISYPVKTGTTELSFEGHSTNQFSNMKLDAYLPETFTTISHEVIFKKGLPLIVSIIAFIVGYSILFYSVWFVLMVIYFKVHIEQKSTEIKQTPGADNATNLIPITSSIANEEFKRTSP